MDRLERIRTIVFLGIDDMFGKDYPYLKAGDFQGIANKIVSSEATANKELMEAVKLICHYHQCEQEGIGSGQPTAKQWYEAVDKLELAIRNAEKATDEKAIC